MHASTEPIYRTSPEDIADHILDFSLSTDLTGRTSSLEIRDSYVAHVVSQRGNYYAPGHGPDASATLPEMDNLHPSGGDTLAEFARANVLPDDIHDLTLADVRDYAAEVAATILTALRARDDAITLLRQDYDEDGGLIEAEITVEVDVAELRTLLVDGLVGATREWIARHPEAWGAKNLAQVRELMLISESWEHLTDLPTFGGADVHDLGTWSWSEGHVLIGDSDDDLVIVARETHTHHDIDDDCSECA